MAEQEKVPLDPETAAEVLGRLKKLEARVAELNDKLSKVHITEEEWKVFYKVSSALAERAGIAMCAPTGCPPFGVPVFACIVVPACTRCSFLWMTACVLPACEKGDGTKPGPDFSGFGGFS